MKIQTEAIQFKADTKLLNRIEQKLQKVGKLFDQIIDTRVRLKLERKGKIKDKILEVRMNLPGEMLMASATDKTFESALDEVSNSLKRQLLKYKDRKKRNQ